MTAKPNTTDLTLSEQLAACQDCTWWKKKLLWTLLSGFWAWELHGRIIDIEDAHELISGWMQNAIGEEDGGVEIVYPDDKDDKDDYFTVTRGGKNYYGHTKSQALLNAIKGVK